MDQFSVVRHAAAVFVGGYPVDAASIERLERAMHDLPDELKLPIRVEHSFAHGIYVRKAYFPAGSVLVGETHRYSHYSMLVSGTMLTNFGDVMRPIEGPVDVIAHPGTKRVGVAVTDVVWVTVHGNPPDTQDPSALEAWLVVPNPMSGRGITNTETAPAIGAKESES